jgi:FtsH-binding integral membrane protein
MACGPGLSSRTYRTGAPCRLHRAAHTRIQHREFFMEGIALLVGPSLVVFGALAWVMSLFKEQAALDAERDTQSH